MNDDLPFASLDYILERKFGDCRLPSAFPPSWISKLQLGDTLASVPVSYGTRELEQFTETFRHKDDKDFPGLKTWLLNDQEYMFWANFLVSNHILGIAHACSGEKAYARPLTPILIRGESTFSQRTHRNLMYVDSIQFGGRQYYIAELV